MTYDFHGSWDQNRAHHSSLNSKDNEKDDTMYIVCFDIVIVWYWWMRRNYLLGFRCKIFSKIGYASQQNDARIRHLRTRWYTCHALHRIQRRKWFCCLLWSMINHSMFIFKSICLSRVVLKSFVKKWKKHGMLNN